MLNHVRQAVRRNWRWQLGASAIVGLSFAVATAFTLIRLGWNDDAAIASLTLMQGMGAWIGAFVAGLLVSAVGPSLSGRRAGPLWLLLVSAGAFAGAALLFAIGYKATFAQWHFPFPSIGWAFQTVFTMAGAVFYYAVQGSRLVLPWVVVPLVALALAFARRPR